MSDESIDDLFSTALTGDREDDTAWKAVTKLHFLGTREVLERASALIKSTDPYRCARGADILGQLGCLSKDQNKTFVPERLHALLGVLNSEVDSLVLDSVIIALGHLRNPVGLHAVLPYSKHPSEDVRYAVAWALPGGLDDPEIIETLSLLMRDSDSDVRDWATFGLGTQSEADSSLIRNALFERLQDDDGDTRAEAAVGLAKRKDLRVLPVVLEELEREEYGVLYEEAASHLLGLDEVKPEGWESWRYVEELRSHFNIIKDPLNSSTH
jgi:HEAT repeat protein